MTAIIGRIGDGFHLREVDLSVGQAYVVAVRDDFAQQRASPSFPRSNWASRSI
jgi:hypothetical protein